MTVDRPLTPFERYELMTHFMTNDRFLLVDHRHIIRVVSSFLSLVKCERAIIRLYTVIREIDPMNIHSHKHISDRLSIAHQRNRFDSSV